MSFRELVGINQKIRESEAYKRVQRIDELRPSVTIFAGNYREPVKTIIACEEDPLLTDIRWRQDVRDLLYEVSRTLHNFAASAIGLVDHTRPYRDEHAPDGQLAELIATENRERLRNV